MGGAAQARAGSWCARLMGAGLYYQATTEVMRQQLADISAETRRAVGAPVGRFESVGDFLAALTGFARRSPERPFPVVIDEFPYLAEAEPGVETVIQRWWDRIHDATPTLKLFLAGSQVSWMREHTLTEHGPLQNRRTGQIEVLPLEYRHAALFYPRLPAEDKVRACDNSPGYSRKLLRPPHPTAWLWPDGSAPAA
ncbi:MAG: hypothetical protein M3Y74_20310 [Chloroflexota bacterium]|nr:hypothetical protein [Chloroflexota bacterium]